MARDSQLISVDNSFTSLLLEEENATNGCAANNAMKYRLSIIGIFPLVRRLVLWGVLCTAGMFLPSPAQSQGASPRIVHRLPEGFCELGESEEEVARREALKGSLGATANVISLSAPCTELETLVSAAPTAFRRWAFLVLYTPTEKSHQDVTNDLYIKLVERQATESPSDTLERLEKRLQRQVREQTPIWPITSDALAWDFAAYYGGMRSAADSENKQVTLMSLTAVTIINGSLVSLVLSELATPTSSYEQLLLQQRRNISQIIELNK